jgi:hypothetical protein
MVSRDARPGHVRFTSLRDRLKTGSDALEIVFALFGHGSDTVKSSHS